MNIVIKIKLYFMYQSVKPAVQKLISEVRGVPIIVTEKLGSCSCYINKIMKMSGRNITQQARSNY